MAVRRKSTTLILVGVLVFILGGAGVLFVLTRGTTKTPQQVATQPATSATTPATTTNGTEVIGAAALNIPKGDVALSLSLSSTEAVGGFPVVGDELDIYGVYKDQPGHTSLQAPLVKLTMANVKILSIQEPAPSTGGGSTVVELAVTPGQAEGLIYLTSFESIYTTLVRPGTTTAPTTPGRNASNILVPASSSSAS